MASSCEKPLATTSSMPGINASIKGSASSWKDEWLVILFSVPLILAFIPGMEGVVANGFEQLKSMPEWYQYSLGVIVAASFGVRSATKFFGKR